MKKKLISLLAAVMMMGVAPSVLPDTSINSSVTVSAATTISSQTSFTNDGWGRKGRNVTVYYSNGSVEGRYYDIMYTYYGGRLEIYSTSGNLLRVYTNCTKR